MTSVTQEHKAVFRVLDVLDAPHTGSGRLLKLRLRAGEALTTRELRGAILRADSPDGRMSCRIRVAGFALFGGRPSDDRIRRTGRVDIHVWPVEGDAEAIGVRWKVSGPVP